MNLKKKKYFYRPLSHDLLSCFKRQIAPLCFRGRSHAFFICSVQGRCERAGVFCSRTPSWKESGAAIGRTLYSPILLLGRSAPTWRKLLLFPFCTKVPCEPSLPLILAFGGGFCSISCLPFVIRSFSSASKYALVWKPQQKF